MAYIGKSPVIGNFVKLDSITVVNGQAAYTMQNGGVNFTSYDNVNQFLVSLNGVLQAPTDSFTVSGSTLTFASNLSTGDVIDFVLVLGNSLDIGTPSDNTVTAAKIASDAVTTAKIADSNITSAKIASGVIQNQSAFKNIIINGDMSIAQRSTSTASITSSGYHTVDRYATFITTLGTWTQSQSTDVPTGQGFAKSLKMDCTTADASPAAGDRLLIQQKIEGQNLQYLKKGTSSAESLTLSFWVKSNKTGTYIAEIWDNDNTRQISQSYTISSADTWEKKTMTFAGDTSGTLVNDNTDSLILHLWLGAGTNYSSGTLSTTWTSNTNANRAVGQVNLADSTSNEWYVTGVQLEVGTAASDFEFLPYDVNRARCERYCRGMGQGVTGMAVNTTDFYFSAPLNPSMRATPTLTFLDNSVGVGNLRTYDRESSSSSFILARSNRAGIVGSMGGFSSLTAGDMLQIHYSTTTEGFTFLCDAEL
jgi:hypothetical protein